MHVVVIDPGFEDLHSHHDNVNEGLFTHIDGKGSDRLLTLAAAKLQNTTEPNLLPPSCIAHFSTPCYTNRLKPLDKNREQELAELFAEELAMAFDEGHIQSQSILVLHTFFSFHLLGLAIWLVRGKDKFVGGVLLCGMFHPGLEKLSSVDESTEFQRFLRYRLATKYLLSVTLGNNIVVATSCVDFVESYKKLFKKQVLIHPIVTRAEGLSEKTSTKTEHKSILLYAGSVKQEKGLEFILDNVEKLLISFPAVEFFVHLNTLSPGIRDFPQAESLLLKLTGKYQNLRCKFGYLSNTDFQELVNSADAVICHYDPLVYRHKTSGLLWDALSRINMGLICTNDCWLSREYAATGGKPFTFDYASLDTLKDALINWLNTNSPFIRTNDYYNSLVKSFPAWVEQRCRDLHKITRAG